jgi:hypothetical protein
VVRPHARKAGSVDLDHSAPPIRVITFLASREVGAVRKTAMSPYKFAALCAGTIIGIAVAVALGSPSHDGRSLKTAKYDVSGSQPDMQCPKLAWPYGCEWRSLVAPEPREPILR